jgi:enamine deaminase RidA (YjgF/YER057c/UK114 family)
MGKELSHFRVPGEQLYGLAQAVRSGDTVHVSGQTASGAEPDGDRPADTLGEMAAQLRRAYAKVADALAPFGATLHDVVDEILFVTDIDAAVRAAPAVRREAYGVETPEVASTLVEVARLAGPGLLVEVKCTARIAP